MSGTDPLTINIAKQLTRIPEHERKQLTCVSSTQELLDVLSQMLARPAMTCAVAEAFRPLLLDLCARWMSDERDFEERFCALCLLIENNEHLFPVLSAFLRRPAFDQGPLAFVESAPSIAALDATRLQRLLVAYYRLLCANKLLPAELGWPASALSALFVESNSHSDRAVRWLAIRCYAMHTGMAEGERAKLEKLILGEGDEEALTWYGERVDGTSVFVDATVLPALELKRVHETRQAIAASPDFYTREDRHSTPFLSDSDLSPWVVNIHGVLMFKSAPLPPPPSTVVVSTPSAINALRAFALHTSLRIPTLITSPPSSGKSLFLSHLASLLFPDTKDQIVTVHLADTSLDPRSLLGSYISSPTQLGTFEWKDGVLVRAMKEGKWLVLKDVDKASMEVLGLIKPLAESMLPAGGWIGGRACVDVPNRGKVYAAERFMMFAMRSVVPSSGTGKVADATFYGAHKFQEVVVDVPSLDEVEAIVRAQFTHLGAAQAIRAIVRLWTDVQRLAPVGSGGLRDLEKFCRRMENVLRSYYPRHMDVDDVDANEADATFPSLFPNAMIREDMYLEARDVFFGAGALTTSAQAQQARIASLIATHLGLDADRQQWVLYRRTASFELEKNEDGDIITVHIGRTRLLARPRKSSISLLSSSSVAAARRPFAMHKPAICLLSRIATALSLSEPILLTGETGTGKTSLITHLSRLLNCTLVSLNLSHQTESSDLLGGFKPVDAHMPASELYARFVRLFGETFSRRRNVKYEESVRKGVEEGRWRRVVLLWKESVRLAKERIAARDLPEPGTAALSETDGPRKRRKVVDDISSLRDEWARFERDVDEFDIQHAQGQGKFAFDFVEGPLVKAIRSGDWVLLDEINLASPETLECITSLLSGPTASITLTEKGSLEATPRHPDFRLFACMNPATDTGKKDLPPNIRARFTEIDVPPPDADCETLLSIVAQYIGDIAVGDKAAIMDVAEFYAAVRTLADERKLADGSDHRPHYSMRTLARALMFSADIAPVYGLRRALWEGCLMAFTMVLDGPSASVVTALAQKHILSGVRNPKSLLSMVPAPPAGEDFVKFGPFYLEKGPLTVDLMEDYIMTPSVEKKLVDLARIVLTRRFPVLIEGPTSSGKTSAVEYLARRTGHQFIRINNHEHTDIQEYIGSYVSDPLTGKLVFKDGLLVNALRCGHWIVLDELNLAPTEVLEALNRLLDDNRELVIPETHEIVRPHAHFMLFATQNPPGLYAGRKILSRAFRNRFLEVHFQDVPQTELEAILCQRCRIAPSYGQRIVSVFQELQKRRQSGRVFESKQGFATLRDLFRWAGRDAVGYQELAENGYMLLAERTRREEDRLVVKDVIESVMKVRIDEGSLYDMPRSPEFEAHIGCVVPPSSSQVVWTYAMRRLFVLVARALRFNEPVLLVGETGSGKTSVCQLYADVSGKSLHTLNCHQNSETADIIGGLRPARNRSSIDADVFQDAVALLNRAGVVNVPTDVQGLITRINELIKANASVDSSLRTSLQELRSTLMRSQALFEWHDGPLVRAMRQGVVFLLDEISLADDSVLERLNSVLEPARTVVLAERGSTDGEYPAIHAADAFKLLATMNPGGDYGKKELSPALRNRFTEIWVPPVDTPCDLAMILDSSWKHAELQVFTAPLLEFCGWLRVKLDDHAVCSLRDMLAWVTFSNAMIIQQPEGGAMYVSGVFHHAAHMTFLDGLGSLPQTATLSPENLQRLKEDAVQKLNELVPRAENVLFHAYDPLLHVQLGPFAILKGPEVTTTHGFNLEAPTTRENVVRVVRACQLDKPILLEGSPGVGKTSLVSALAKIAGYHLCRINLSDQTDLIDLLGSDLPVENGAPGEFAWKDAEFLRAMQKGHWVLLDEMNLAPQTVLEGLNAILDHRGTVFIPELGRTFVRHPSFRVFAAQNPLHQGGGRKGLPKSFLDRFTKVYVEELSSDDMFIICREQFEDCDENLVRGMIAFNTLLNCAVVQQRSFGREGSPWEFNLRDIIRWGELLRASAIADHPRYFFRIVYLSRFRNPEDRSHAEAIFNQAFPSMGVPEPHIHHPLISRTYLQIGHFSAPRGHATLLSRSTDVLQVHLTALETIWACLSRSWLVIVTGQRDSGKSCLIRTVADLSGNRLEEIGMTSATDTSDILGGFEQVDQVARVSSVASQILELSEEFMRSVPGVKYRYRYHGILRRELTSATRTGTSVLQVAAQLLEELAATNPVDSNFNDHVHDLQSTVLELSRTETLVGRFDWVDGPLIRAMKRGHWLVIDGANICNPSVLDRLNSLCEMNGVLTLSERGFVDGNVQVLKPHPNFRLFMTVDPQHGELSRAMRNRGLEVSLLTSFTTEDRARILASNRLPEAPEAASPVAYEMIRRGIVTQNDKLPMAMISGTVSDDVISKYLAIFSSIIDADNTISIYAIVPFVTRALPRSLLTVMRRYLQATSPSRHICFIFENCFVSHIASKLACVLEEPTISIAEELVDVLPLDDFMVCPPCSRCTERSQQSHSLRLQILDLFAALILDKFENSKPRDLRSQLPSRLSETVSEGIQSVLVEINAATQNMFESFLSRTNSFQSDDFDVSVKLLGFSRQLRCVLAGDNFDYSAAQVLTQLISTAVESRSPIYGHVTTASTALNATISPSSGLGLVPIWARLRNVRAVELGRSVISYLENGLQDPQSDGQKSLFDRFQMLALASFPITHQSSRNAEITTISNQIREYLGGLTRSGTTTGPEQGFSNPVSLLVELQAICEAQWPVENVLTTFAQVIQVGLEVPSENLRRFVPYQHIIWALDTMDGVPASIMAEMHISWLESLWHQGPVKQDLLDGPNILFRPTQLYLTSEKCELTSVPLSSLEEHEASVQRHLCLIIRQCYTQHSRFEQLTVLFNQGLDMMASCFSTFLDDGQIQLNKNGGLLKDTQTLLSILGRSSFEPLQKAVLHLTPALHFNASETGMGVADLGRCWIALSRVFLDLFVPDIPLDPAAILRFSMGLLQEEAQLLKNQITLHTYLERRTSGETSNTVISYLASRVKKCSVSQEPLSGIPNRSSIASLNAFWSEVSQFMKQIIHYPKVDDLILALVSRDSSAFKREDVIQGSISGFTQRLVNLYPEFDDIVSILRLAFSQLKLGLRLVRHAYERLDVDSNESAYATSLVAFPSIRSASLLQSQSLVERGISTGEQLLLVINATTYYNFSSNLSQLTQVAQTAYEQIYRLWAIDRARDEKREQDLGSLYRKNSVSHDASFEAEMEEMEFLELFPMFEDAFPHSEPPRSGNDAKGVSHHLTPSQHRQLLALHLNLTGHKDTDSHFITVRHTVLQSYLRSHFLSLPDSLDRDALPQQIGLLQSHLTLLGGTVAATRPGNFYTDANVPEAKKGLRIIRSLHSRLVNLLEVWPDQMVLHHLLDRCDLILAFDINSSVAKLLSVLEQLLLQTEDWEMYANRENSLKPHQIAITNLIVEWRRLELSCWNGLLESQSRIFTDEVAEYWFRLYELLIRGPLSAAEDGLPKYLQQLPSLLDDFIRTSSLGQFKARLDLLRSFETLISRLVLKDADQAVLSCVRRIVHFSWRSYDLFASDLSISLENQRRTLAKEIEGFIKLASWRDVNVQALKQSARKTHYQLYKIIRKFRDILRQPIVDKLIPLFSVEITEDTKQVEQSIFSCRYATPSRAFLPNSAFSPSPLPAYRGNLEKTLEIFHEYLDTRIRKFLVRNEAHDIQELSASISLTAKELTSQAIPEVLNKERRGKYRKNLLMRRRKAWSDLQKELRRGGLAYRIKPDVSNQLRSESWIRGQPLLCPVEDIITTERGEIYFDRLRGCFPSLWDALVSHHSDLGTGDLSRGASLVESGYSLALETRSMLAQTLSSHTTLLRQINRLKTIAHAPVLVRIESSDQLELLRQVLSVSVCAMDELVEAIRLFPQTQDGPSIVGPTQDCMGIGASLRVFRSRIAEFIENSQPVMATIMLEEEHTALTDASQMLQSLPIRLDEMARTFPQFNYLLGPTSQWIRDQGEYSFPAVGPSRMQPVSDMDSVIDTLLVSVQNMLRQCPEPSDQSASVVPDTDGPADNYIRTGARTTSLFTALLDLPGVAERISIATTELVQLPHDLLRATLQRMLPFLECFGEFAGGLLKSQALWTIELFRLDYILCSMVHTLATRGFCIPLEPEEGESAAGNEQGRELEGTGVGEGTGVTNASKEIQDESQVEGLQGDESEETERGGRENDENAIEMNEDFGGELEDVPEEDEGDGDAEEDGEGPEDQLADLDKSDPNVVDEKLWGDTTGEHEEQKEHDELHEDRSEQAKGESEMVAKEGKQVKESAVKEKEEQQAKTQADEGEEGEEGEEEEMDEDKPYPNEAGAPMDEHIPDANTLDLPEDMNLDDNAQGDRGDFDADDATDNGDLGSEDQMDEDEARRDADTMDDVSSVAGDETQPNDQHPYAVEESKPDETGTEEGQIEEDAVAKPDLMSGDGDADADENVPRSQDSAKDGQKGTASSQVLESIAGEERAADSEQIPFDRSSSKPELQHPPQPTPQTEANLGAGSEGIQSGPTYPQTLPTSPPVPDPLRKLGDALKEIQQRFDEIFGPPEETHPPEGALQSGDAEQVMYEHDEYEDGMQALGPTAEEQVAKLRDLTLVEKGQDELKTMDIDAPIPGHDEGAQQIAMERLLTDKTSERTDTDLEGAIAHTERNRDGLRTGSPSSLDFSAPKAINEPEPAPEIPSASDEDVRAALESLSSDSQIADLSAYTHLWTLYTSLTMPLSIALCESLRLILAPTLATRLRGDFRTGKRLNMRRVITWVASEYTKDRIWLRRVKPSARSYQVLLAVDDSASMRSDGGGAVHLAFQTVVLVAQALGRLEAGEIGVARFGAGWELVRGFGEDARNWGSSPAAGGRVLSSLTFQQKRTDVAGFLEGSLGVLEAARDAAGTRGAAKDLWQLEIIISDGICQEHERLRCALRRARSMRVLVVFIVLDALNDSGGVSASTAATSSSRTASAPSSSTAQSSILTLNQVSYRQSPTTGQTELTMERYLDSFPFEYYVVLRDVEALPRVLADTLREFFERVAEE